jgi:hypothetical protein
VLGSLRYSLYQGANASHEGFPLWGRSAINGDGFSRKVLGGRGEKKHGKKSNATLAPQADTGLFGGIFIRFFFHPRDRVYHLALGGKKSCKFICHLSAWVAFNFFNSTFRLEAARPSFPENEQILVIRGKRSLCHAWILKGNKCQCKNTRRLRFGNACIGLNMTGQKLNVKSCVE